MSSIVEGFQNQIWLVIKYDSMEEVWEKRIPFSETSEADIIKLLGEHSGGEVIKDNGNGNRLIYTAGQYPHYIASLWRADELEKRDLRNSRRT